MTESTARARWRPSPVQLIAGALVIGGFLLTGVSWWFLVIAALGTFGPGVLRELGLLRDRDEFQRRADHRAGYHAFLTTGIVSVVLVAFFRSGERVVEHPGELATLFLALLWCTWFFSSLLAYWGPQKTAARVLYAFGTVWLAFTILSNVGSEWTGWTALLLHPLLTVPFFVLGWLSGRWPRVAGVLLLVAAAGLFLMLGGFRSGGPPFITHCITLILFIGPLLGSGVALLGIGAPDAEDD